MNKKIVAWAAAGLFAGTVAFGGITTWTGAIDDNFNNASNWDNGLPTYGSANEGIISTDGAAIRTTSTFYPGWHVYVGFGTNMTSAATLTITNAFRPNSNRFLGVGYAGGMGVVNQSTTNLTQAGRLYIGSGAGTNLTTSIGTYNFNGGILDITASAGATYGQMFIGTHSSDIGTLNLAGNGTVSVGTMVTMAQYNNSQGYLNVAGGNLDITFAALTVGTGSGAFGATIDSTGISTIKVTGDFEVDNSMNFNLALGAGYTHVANTVYTLIDAASFSGDGAFGNVTDGQEIDVDGNKFIADYDTVNAKFTLTAIPEPATIGMLGLGALITLVIRRKLTI